MNYPLKKIVLITAAIAVVSLGIAAAIFFATGMSGPWEESGGISVDERKSFSVESIGEINVKTSSLDVNVERGEGSGIDVHLHGRVYSGRPESIPSLGAEARGEILGITIERKDGRAFVLGFYSDNLVLDIRIPRPFEGDLVVRTSSGDVVISEQDLDNLSVETSSGDIRLHSVDATTVAMESSSGDQKVEELQADFSQFTSSSGEQWIDDLVGSAKATSTSGDITLAFRTFASDLEVHASSGDVYLSLTDAAEFQLQAKASSGDIDCAFPLTLDAQDSEIRDNRMIGSVGQGTHTVKVRTSSGDITIRP